MEVLYGYETWFLISFYIFGILVDKVLKQTFVYNKL
jgi:hypothetical protein